mmetsp:Transcript_110873/g.192193  ORF Transcript_110873/g.192193 Transcript_110873/m.192193 type:complete len:180 (-) Transcript_110873:259-798(-)
MPTAAWHEWLSMGVFPPPFSTATAFLVLSGSYFTASDYITEYFKNGETGISIAPVEVDTPVGGGESSEASFEEDVKGFFGGMPNFVTFAVLILDVLALVIATMSYLGFCKRKTAKSDITGFPPDTRDPQSDITESPPDTHDPQPSGSASGEAPSSPSAPKPRLGGSMASTKPKPAMEGV